MKPQRLATLFAGALALAGTFHPGAAAAQSADQTTKNIPADSLSAAIFARISLDDGLGNVDAGDERVLSLYEFYELQSYAPIWVDKDGPRKKARDFLDVLKNSGDDALHPSDYGIDRLSEMMDANSLEALADLEITLSKTLLEYGAHLSAGRIDPRKVDRELYISAGPAPKLILEGAASNDDIAEFTGWLAPNTPNYSRLREKLTEYRKIVADGGWTQVPSGDKSLKPDDEGDPRTGPLCTRMIEAGYLAAGAHEGDIYDGALVAAVELFQERHGLEVDGVVGPNTLKEINVTAAERVRQMELNMERRRWMTDDLGDYYVFVNLADQFLKVVSNDKTIHTTLLVVGKTYHRTPVFSDEMTYIEINPHWNVPYSIATKEYLPKLKNNPGVLPAQNIRVFSGGSEVSPYAVDWNAYSRGNFPFRLRQDPGNRNALGRVKFMFPNDFSIYTHDTPSKSLFSRASRFYSHGCMRAQNPFDLAEVLLAPEGWDRARIDRARDSDKKRVVKLSKPIPVHITYLTAWVNKDGTVHFRRDAKLAKALDRVKVN